MTLGKFAHEDLSIITQLRSHLILLIRKMRQHDQTNSISQQKQNHKISSSSNSNGNRISSSSFSNNKNHEENVQKMFDIWSGQYIESSNETNKSAANTQPIFSRKESGAEISNKYTF